MKRAWPAIVAVSAVVAAGLTMGAGPSAARDTGAAGSWGRAIQVPGLAALNKGGEGAMVLSVSCASLGGCAAGGRYTDDSFDDHGFVVSQQHGRWGKAIEVPSLAALSKGGSAEVDQVACGSAGNCVATGFYRDGEQEFVAVERNGRWGLAMNQSGLPTPDQGRQAGLNSVSCGSADTCTAAGSYSDRHHHQQGFVVVERNGRWAKATEMPGLAALNKGEGADVLEVSCTSAGDCAAGGGYSDRPHHEQGFVAVERNGRWAKAIPVPGLAALNKGGTAGIGSVSCASPGNCAASGGYADRRDIEQGVTVSERHGHWGKVITLRGLDRDTGRDAIDELSEVSCASARICVAAGNYTSRKDGDQGFVVIDRNGRWGKATGVPGLGTLNAGGFAEVNAVSCPPAGRCTAGGDYTDGHGDDLAFVTRAR